MIVYLYLWIILKNVTNFSQTDFKKTSQDFTISSTCAPWHSPCAQLNTVFPFSRYSTKGLYIFSLAEPDHFMSLLNGERWYIAISRLIPTLLAGKLWPAKLSDEARGHGGRSILSGPRFGLLLSALYTPSGWVPWYSGVHTLHRGGPLWPPPTELIKQCISYFLSLSLPKSQGNFWAFYLITLVFYCFDLINNYGWIKALNLKKSA